MWPLLAHDLGAEDQGCHHAQQGDRERLGKHVLRNNTTARDKEMLPTAECRPQRLISACGNLQPPKFVFWLLSIVYRRMRNQEAALTFNLF